jgi:predicted Zn-dependent peptidase
MTRAIVKTWLAAGAAAALLMAGPALAQTGSGDPYPARPAVAPPKPFTLPATETYTLPNGLEVTLIPYGLTPKTVVSLRVGTGNIDDGDATWLADMVGDMLREGAAGRTAAQISEEAAAMGGGLGIGVGMHETTLALNVLSEHGPAAVGLLADVALRPTFPESELARLKSGRLRQLAVARASAQSQGDAALAAAVFGVHPYGRVFPTTEQVNGYSMDQIRAFHASNFGAARSRLYVAGRFDAAAMKSAIAAQFGDWAAGREATSLPAAPAEGPRVILVDRPGAAQSTLRLAFMGPAIGQPGDLDARVMNTLLGGAFNSRITKNIREAKGYTYSPGSGFSYLDRELTQWGFDADVTTAVTGAALTEVFGEIRRLQTEAPTPAEAQGARTYMAGIFVLQNASAAGVLNQVANRDLYGLSPEWLNRYVEGVLAVGPERIQQSAASHLPLDRMTLVVVGDLATVRPQLDALPELQGAVFETVSF